MDDTSDPSSAGRGARRRARRTVERAYAQGQIAEADRALRRQQIDAAATKGDLAMVVRDLTASAPVVTQSARQQTPAPYGRPAPGSTRQPSTPLPGSTSTRKKAGTGRTRLITGLVSAVLVLFVGGPLVRAGIDAVRGAADGVFTPTSTSRPSAHRPATLLAGDAWQERTWRQFVAAVDEEFGTTRVWSLFVYPDRYSAYVVVDGDRSQFVTWSRGELRHSLPPRDEPSTSTNFALDVVDPALLATTARKTADAAGNVSLTTLSVHLRLSKYDASFYRGTAVTPERKTSSVSLDQEGDAVN